MTIGMIPKDPMIYIFSYLHVKDLLTAGQVCKQWKELTSSEALWSKISLHTMPHTACPKEISWKTHYLKRIPHLRMSQIAYRRGTLYTAFGNTIASWKQKHRELKYTFTCTNDGSKSLISCFALRNIGLNTLMITGSIDHKIRVWTKHSQSSQFMLDATAL